MTSNPEDRIDHEQKFNTKIIQKKELLRKFTKRFGELIRERENVKKVIYHLLQQVSRLQETIKQKERKKSKRNNEYKNAVRKKDNDIMTYVKQLEELTKENQSLKVKVGEYEKQMSLDGGKTKKRSHNKDDIYDDGEPCRKERKLQ